MLLVGLRAPGPERVAARSWTILCPGTGRCAGRSCAAARDPRLEEEGGRTPAPRSARPLGTKNVSLPWSGGGVPAGAGERRNGGQGVRGLEPSPPALSPKPPPPPTWPPLLRQRPEARSPASGARCLRSLPGVCPPPPAPRPPSPGARRARSLPLRSGRAGGFGLRRGGEAGERVSARGGSECLCESPVPGVRAAQSERRGARAGAEPEPASAAAPPRRQAPLRTHPRRRRLPARRAARSPPAPRPAARRPPACPEACARCGKVVYPTEKVNCLDKYWHKGCFHCEVCKMALNMNNYKGYEKKPYCNAHYPKQSFTTVADTPENLRLKQQSELQSQVKYKRDFEESKGRGFSIVTDTPELQRLKRTQEQISNVKYHEDFEKTKGRGFTPVVDDPVTERVRRNTQVVSDAAYKGVHPHIVEMDRRPGIIVDLKVWRTDPGSIFDIDPLEDNIQSRSLHMLSEKANLYRRQRSRSYSSSTFGTGLGDDKSEISEIYRSFSCCSEVTRPSDEGAPVLPGAYQQSHSQGYGYMHQTSLSSVRSMQHSPNLRTYRAMYDYSAQDEDEVSFRDGDYIVNVQPIDDGWMYGTVQRTGKTGMLPANYIDAAHLEIIIRLSDPHTVPASSQASPTSETTQEFASTLPRSTFHECGCD
ncbi:hypothetical protein R6Z07F_012053 [Ovis aries]